MSGSQPIACTLTAEERPGRLAEMAAVGAGSLVAVEGDGVLRFRSDVATRERLEAIVAAESHCCAFLHFALSEDAGALTLRITGPELGRPMIAELVAAFAGRH